MKKITVLLTLPLLAATALGIVYSTQPTSAATPPDSCFAFNAGTGTITNYYAHEGNNPANPACPKDVDIPATIGGTSVMVIGNNAFYNKQITTVTLGSSVTTIGIQAFSDNQLTTVTIPNSVISIANYAFSGNHLTTVTITGNPTTIGTEILSGNPVETISYNGTTYTAAASNHESCFVFNAGTGTITNFRHADPVLIKSNGNACLDSDVIIPSTVGGVAVTTIGNSAFSVNQLTAVTIPNSVTSIGNGAFSGNQLTTVTIPNSVTSIGNSVFYNNQLTTVTLGSSVTSIGNYAFSSNHLTTVTLGNAVTTIGEAAFITNRLSDVVIPSSVVSIGNSAFAIQSQWGTDINNGTNGAPPLFSWDPAESQPAYDSIWYARLYTEDPSNPNNLKDNVMSEDWWSSDYNANNLNDSLGGHLINPSSTELHYVNQSSTSLQASRAVTGQLPDSSHLNNYYVSQGPAMHLEWNDDWTDYTPESLQSIEEGFAAYHRLGDSVTFTPPSISGYQTPSPHTLTLSQPTTEHSFVYTANATNPPAQPPTKHTGAPKLTKVTWTNAKPTLRGLFDSSSTARLQVTFAGQTFVLGESTELTADGDSWTLDLTTSSATFEADTYEVTIEATDADGNILSTEETATLTQAMLDGREGELAETGESRMYAVGGAVTLLLAGSYALIRVNRTAKRGNV